MTVYLIHSTDTGNAVSIGSVIANPLPAGLTAVPLSTDDAQALRAGTVAWDAATRTLIPPPVDPAVANEQTIEGRTQAHIDALRLVKGSSGTLSGLQLSNAARANAAATLDLLRVVQRKLDSAD